MTLSVIRDRVLVVLILACTGCGRKAEDVEPPSSVQAELRAIHENARLVAEKMEAELGVQLGYDQKSVEWLDGYINRNREKFDPATREKLVSAFGSFLGQAIVEVYDGKWTFSDEYGWGVDVGGKLTAFPFKTTRDHFENGSEDSIASFFRLIPVMIRMSEEESQSEKTEAEQDHSLGQNAPNAPSGR